MTNELILTLENKIHGYHTRLKELHYAAPSVSIHKILDDFDEALLKFDDEIMEESQSLFGFFHPGDISPILPEAITPEDLLQEIRGTLAGLLEATEDSRMWTGIRSETEGFWHTLNKTLYLIRIALKEENR